MNKILKFILPAAFVASLVSGQAIWDMQFNDTANAVLPALVNSGTEQDAMFDFGGKFMQTNGTGELVIGLADSVGKAIPAGITDIYRESDSAQGFDALTSGQYRFEMTISVRDLAATAAEVVADSDTQSFGVRFIVGSAKVSTALRFNVESATTLRALGKKR
jgi:hypothetical protein